MEKKKIAVEEELHEVGQMLTTLPKEILQQEKITNMVVTPKKSYTEVWNNAKPREMHQNAPNRVKSTEVRIF